MFRAVSLILLIALATLVAVLAYHNAGNVTINYVLGSFDLPMAMVLGLAFVVGTCVAGLLFVPGYLRQKREIRRLNKTLADGRKELDNLRSMPLRDD